MSPLFVRKPRGFALPVVILTLAALGAIAVGVIPKGTAGVVDAASFERRTRERLLIEAGLARGILALVALDDPMTEALRRDGSVAWTFAGRDLTIAIRPESDKLDLNAADPGALAAVLERVLGPDLGARARDLALEHRGQLTSPDQILSLAQRFSQSAARLRDVMTVYGGRVDDRQIQSASADGVTAASSSERPIYTVRAWLTGRSRARAVTVLIEPEARRYAIVERAEFVVEDTGPDQ